MSWVQLGARSAISSLGSMSVSKSALPVVGGAHQQAAGLNLMGFFSADGTGSATRGSVHSDDSDSNDDDPAPQSKSAYFLSPAYSCCCINRVQNPS